MKTLIELYLLINFFIAGYQFRDSYQDDLSGKKLSSFIIWMAVCGLFGILLFSIITIIVVAETAADFFLLRFWFKFYFTNLFRNLPTDTLQKMNEIYIAHFEVYKCKNDFKKWMQLRALIAVNRRHRYIYTPKQ